MADRKHGKDVVRYTLQSFVGPHIANVKISERQKDAIQRLIYLSNEKFEGLCEDIVNEIHNRSGMRHSREGPMYEKLARLSDEKFRNLVVDTLLVYNYRNPGTEVLHIDDFLNNLQNLIQDLKSQSEGEKFTEKIRGMGFFNILLEYNRYVKKTRAIDAEITDEVERIIRSEIESASSHFLECLSYPEALLSRMDGSPVGQSAEYRFHRDNIAIMMGEMKGDALDSKAPALPRASISKIMKGELQQIIMLAMDSTAIPADSIELRYPELLVVVRALESIADDMNGRVCVSLEAMSDELTAALDQLIGTLSKGPDEDTEALNQIKMHRVPIEGMADSVTKLDAFKLVVSLALDLHAIFKRPLR